MGESRAFGLQWRCGDGLLTCVFVQGSIDRRDPGCVNAAGKLRQKW